jgi:hypothetical protein
MGTSHGSRGHTRADKRAHLLFGQKEDNPPLKMYGDIPTEAEGGSQGTTSQILVRVSY